MPQQAEPGHIGGGLRPDPEHRLGGRPVERGHDGGGLLDQGGGGPLPFQCRGDDAHRQRLREHEGEAGRRPRRAHQPLGVHHAGDRHPVLRLLVLDRVATHDGCPGLARLVGAPLQHPGKQVEVQVLGPPEQVEGQDRPSSHGVAVAEGVGRRDGAPDVGVVDDRGEKVDGQQQRQVVADPVDGGVVGRVESQQEVRVLAAVVLAEAAQDLRQVTGTELAGSAGAVRELGEAGSVCLHWSFISAPRN